MKKGFKVLMGLCLAAVLVIGGAKGYAHAANSFEVDGARGGCYAGYTKGTAYTTVSRTSCYGSVTASFYGYSGGRLVFSLGDSAGGEHGSGVEINYDDANGNVKITRIEATHTATVYGDSYTRYTDDIWYD